MSEAGEATTTTTTITLPQAPAEAAAAVPQDPAPKSPVGSGASQAAAPAPAALVAGNPGGDAAPAATGTAAPASSAHAGSEDAEKKVLGESGRGGWGLLRVGPAAAGGRARAGSCGCISHRGGGVTVGSPALVAAAGRPCRGSRVSARRPAHLAVPCAPLPVPGQQAGVLTFVT